MDSWQVYGLRDQERGQEPADCRAVPSMIRLDFKSRENEAEFAQHGDY